LKLKIITMAIKDRTAKVQALRTATASLYASLSIDWEDADMDDVEKINKHLKRLAESMYKRAVKMGGDFNPYTGF
jgi:hypothetical protein